MSAHSPAGPGARRSAINRKDHLDRLRKACASAERVLDVGAGLSPCTWATHRIDLLDFDEASQHGSYKDVWGDGEPRCPRANHVQMDLCSGPWPYPDAFFDFVIASHILEDVRDPLHVVREMARVGRAGYVETPSRARESFSKERFFRLRRAFGRVPDIGWEHHRWFVECEGTHLRFTQKSFLVMTRGEFHLTRREFPRKLAMQQASLGVFWEGEITAEEVLLLDRRAREEDLRGFRREYLATHRPRRGFGPFRHGG